MFAMSRRDIKDAYRCGNYHRRGLKGCTSHHIRVDKLDELVKEYVRKVKDNSAAMLERLNADLAKEDADIGETERAAENLAAVLADVQDELKATKRARIRDIMKHPEQEETLDTTYDELESDLVRRMDGLQNQISMAQERRSTIIEVNRIAKTAMDVFDDILQKPRLERNDLELIIRQIKVFEDHIDVQLKPDIDMILKSGSLSAEEAANFPEGIADISQTRIVQSSAHRPGKVYDVNVISNGDPLEIFTNKDGEVIFKKYSPIGELGDFAAQICDSLHKSTDSVAAVCDRDSVIAISGGARKELLEKSISPELEDIMEARGPYRRDGTACIPVTDGDENFCASVAVPIISEGDVLGCVMFVTPRDFPAPSDVECKLAQTVASFLGKQMES
jgi:stage V sporulation protein T